MSSRSPYCSVSEVVRAVGEAVRVLVLGQAHEVALDVVSRRRSTGTGLDAGELEDPARQRRDPDATREPEPHAVVEQRVGVVARVRRTMHPVDADDLRQLVQCQRSAAADVELLLAQRLAGLEVSDRDELEADLVARAAARLARGSLTRALERRADPVGLEDATVLALGGRFASRR